LALRATRRFNPIKALLFNPKKACGSTRLYRIGLKPQLHHRCSIVDADRSRRAAPFTPRIKTAALATEATEPEGRSA